MSSLCAIEAVQESNQVNISFCPDVVCKQALSFAAAVELYGKFSCSYPPRELVAMEALPTKNALGESPVWSDKDQALYWVS